MVLEIVLSLKSSIVYIQVPFVERCKISYNGFNLYWPFRFNDWKNIQAFITIQKDFANEIIFENRSNLINHSYYIALDIKELHQKTSKVLWKTRVVNIYDNIIGKGHI